MLDNVQLSIVQGQKFQTEHQVPIKIEQVLIDNQSIDAKNSEQMLDTFQ